MSYNEVQSIPLLYFYYFTNYYSDLTIFSYFLKFKDVYNT